MTLKNEFARVVDSIDSIPSAAVGTNAASELA
jgi:hypothetical protein